MAVLVLALYLLPGILYAGAAGWWRRLPWPEAFLGAMVASLVVIAWLGLVLAELACFSLGNLTLAVALLSLGGAATWFWRRTRRPTLADTTPRTAAGGSWRSHLGLAALLLIALWLYRLPGEMAFGTHDAGARYDSAVQLARTGTFYVSSPTLPVALGTGSLSSIPGLHSLDVYPGITALLPDVPSRLQLPQFEGAHEVWLAVGYSLLGGVRLADLLPAPLLRFNWPTAPLFLYFTPLCGLLALCALYHLGRRLFGDAVALLAAALLAVSFPQVYYSTITMSEVPTQLLLVGSAWAFGHFASRDDRYAAVLSASALGVAFLARVDVLPVFGLVGLWAGYLVLRRRLAGRHWYFLMPALLLLLHSGLHYLHFLAPYFGANFWPLWAAYGGRALVLAALALLGAAVLYVWRRSLWPRLSGLWDWLGLARQRAWLAIAVVALGGFEYIIRPMLSQPRLVYSLTMQEYVPSAPERTLVMLGWYVTPWLLLAATVGLALLVRDGVGWLRTPLVAVGLGYTSLLLYEAYVTPHHVFWVRRFVPEVLPFLMLCAAYGVVALARAAPGRVAPVLGTGLSACLLTSLCLVTWPLVTSPPEDAGAIGQLARLGALLKPDSVVLLERTPAAAWVALPLSLVYGQTTYLLPAEGAVNARAVAQALDEWRGQGRVTYVLAERGGSKLSWRDFPARLVGEAWFSFPYLDRSYDHLPTNRITGSFNAEVYEFLPTSAGLPTFPFTVAVGSGDYGYVSGGWEARERDGDATYRFAGPVASLSLPWPAEQAAKLTLVANGDRPANAPPAWLRISVADQPVGEVTFGNDSAGGFRTYSFAVPPLANTASGEATVRLEVNPWVPAQYGKSDTRELGVAVASLRVEPGP